MLGVGSEAALTSFDLSCCRRFEFVFLCLRIYDIVVVFIFYLTSFFSDVSEFTVLRKRFLSLSLKIV